MIPYLIVFVISFILTFIGQKLYLKRKVLGWSFFALAILLLTIFATLRDFSVGTDLAIYKANYNKALGYDSLNNFLSTYNGESLHHSLIYLSAHLFGSIRIFMFVVALAPLIVIYHYGNKLAPKYLSFMVLIYLLMFFNTSLNVMRQAAAISFLIPAFFMIRDHKNIKAILCIIVAALFHTSALFMLVLFPLYYFSKQKNQLKYYLIVLTTFAALCILLNFLPHVQDILPGNIGRYVSYLNTGETNLNAKFFLLKSGFLIFITYFYKFFQKDSLCRNLYYLAICDYLFYFFSNFVQYGYRLSYYFVPFYAFFIPLIYQKLPTKYRKLFALGIALLLVVYWFGRNLIGYDGTIPYLMGEL